MSPAALNWIKGYKVLLSLSKIFLALKEFIAKRKNRLYSSYIMGIIYIRKAVMHMTIDTNTMISITEANQNFSKVTKLVDELGTAVILKNNTPRYLVIDFSKADQESNASDEDVLSISNRLLKQNKEAYEVLAK